MQKIMTVVGARPQFIKAAPVSKAIRDSSHFKEIVVHTGQHYDQNMSWAFFDELDMGFPNHNLEVASGNHGLQTGEMMKRLEPIVQGEKPDLMVVYGDTNSTLAAALVASKLCLPIAHIEAGLRSFNKRMPEEINRILTDHVSNILFCPTQTAVSNLEREGITKNVWKTGDVMYDVALQFSEKSKSKSTILSDLRLRRGEYILATIHRPENTDIRNNLMNIFQALEEVSKTLRVIVPLHPRTRKMLTAIEMVDQFKDLDLVDPLGFLDMMALESNAKLIVTDSGGVQKEAYFHKVPCVTLRNQTEWVETLEAKWNKLVTVSSAEEIRDALLLSMSEDFERTMIHDYGDGSASVQIVRALECYLEK
jgi:UDP-N-acetylglucosamine 2-epimerase